MERRSLLANHRGVQEAEGPNNAIDGTQRDRENLSNEKPNVDDGSPGPTAEEWNRDVDVLDGETTAGGAAASAAAGADKEIPKTNNSGDDGTTSGIPIRVTIPPLLLVVSPTPDRLTFEQVRTVHDAAERAIETYFALLSSDDNDRNILEDGITFSYLKLLGVTLDEWVGSDGRSVCGVDVQDATVNSCNGEKAKTCVYGSLAEEEICPNSQLCFANIAPSCAKGNAKDNGERRRLGRGPARREDVPSRNLAADAYTVIQLAGGIANFRVVAPAAAPNEKRLGRLSEKAIEKGLTKALADLNDPVLGSIVDVAVTPLTSSDAPFLGVSDPSEEGNVKVVDEKEDAIVDEDPKETTEIKDNNEEDAKEEALGNEDENNGKETQDEADEDETQEEGGEEETAVATEPAEPPPAIATESDAVDQSPEVVPPSELEQVPSTIESEVPPTIESEVPSTIESEVPPTIESEVPPTIESEVPPTIESEVPPTIESEVPPTIESEVPPTIESEVPSTIESEVPPTIESEVPSTIESEVPSTIESEVPPTIESPNETIANDIPPVMRDPPTESSGTVLPGVPLGTGEGDEGGSTINFKKAAETAPANNAPLITGVVTGMILLAIGMVFSVIAFRRHKYRNKGSAEDDTDNLVDFEGRHESDLEASEGSNSDTQGRSKSPPALATIKETDGEANEEGSGGTDESSSISALNQDVPESLVSPNELSSVVRSRSPPKARQLQKEQLHNLLDQDMISISETTVSHTDTSLGQGAGIRPSESFEIRRHFESITVRKDMMMPDITTGMESRDHRSPNVLNTELARVPKNVDVEDRGNLITYPRHLQQQKGRQHRTTTGLNIQSEV